MNLNQYNEIIEFAIEREREAVKFYRSLQQKVKFSAQVTMLKELEAMEEGHIKVLEELQKKGPGNVGEKTVETLKIADYLVEKEPSDNMSFQDIVVIAMKREEKAEMLYNDLAGRMEGDERSAVLKRLAAEEAGHKLRFEKIYDEVVLKDN